jgi:hypothetical protein
MTGDLSLELPGAHHPCVPGAEPPASLLPLEADAEGGAAVELATARRAPGTVSSAVPGASPSPGGVAPGGGNAGPSPTPSGDGPAGTIRVVPVAEVVPVTRITRPAPELRKCCGAPRPDHLTTCAGGAA